VFERLGDDVGLARALLVVADAYWLRCQVGPTEPLLERAREHAARARDERTLSKIRLGLIRAAAVGPMPVEAAVRRCREILEEAAGDRRSEAVAANALAYLEAIRGRFDEARVLAARSRTILEDLGMVMMIAAQNAWAGQVEMLAGDPAAAEELWRSTYETLDGLGEKGNLSTIAAFLAEALFALGRPDEAERFTDVSEQTATSDDVTSQIAWRVTRSKLRAHRGDLEEAEALAREAISRAEDTDWPYLRGAARMSLAEVLIAARRFAEAAEVAREAVEIYEAKGDIASGARELLERTLSPAAAPVDRAS
jgi:ATP/maltotriose-dependent transcriptional regulator MalT